MDSTPGLVQHVETSVGDTTEMAPAGQHRASSAAAQHIIFLIFPILILPEQFQGFDPGQAAYQVGGEGGQGFVELGGPGRYRNPG